jgi:hypothetical protein
LASSTPIVWFASKSRSLVEPAETTSRWRLVPTLSYTTERTSTEGLGGGGGEGGDEGQGEGGGDGGGDGNGDGDAGGGEGESAGVEDEGDAVG